MSGASPRSAREAGPPVLLTQRGESTPKSWKCGGGPMAADAPAKGCPERESAGVSPEISKAKQRCSLMATVVGILFAPCQLFCFVRDLHTKFGGFVTVGVSQYGINQGLGNGIGSLAQRYFLKDVLHLEARPGFMQNIRTAAKIPWNVKPVVGMLSDALPILGFHRTSYIGIAAGLGSIAYLCLGVVPLTAALTVPFMFFVNLSIATPDIMVDATAAKLSKDAPESASDLQSLVWGALSVGSVVASATSGKLVEWLGPQHVFLLCVIPPFTLVITSFFRCLPEERLPREQRKVNFSFLRKHIEVSILAGCMSIVAVTLSVLQVLVESAYIRGGIIVTCGVVLSFAIYFCLRRITPILAKTALFCFLRECVQPSLGDPMFVWMTSDPTGPMFSPMIMGALGVVGSVGLLAGIVLYNKYLTNVSYRKIFLMAQVVMVFYNLSDLILVKRWNLEIGLPDVIFVAGDDALGELIGRFFMMPLFVLCSKVCPDNLEATLFAMLMALLNFGSTVGDFFGSALCDAFGVKNGNFDMLPMAVISKSLCRLLAIPLIFILVPNLTPEDPIPGADPRGAADDDAANPDIEESVDTAAAAATVPDGRDAAASMAGSMDSEGKPPRCESLSKISTRSSFPTSQRSIQTSPRAIEVTPEEAI